MNKNDDFNYYQIVRTNLGDAPNVMEDFSIKPNGCDFLNMGELAVENEIAHLQFRDERKYRKLDTDHFNLELAGVFSKKIVDVLSQRMPIHGLQLVPAEIKDNDNKIIKDYWVANIYQQIECFSEKDCLFDDDMGWLSPVHVALDKETLNRIPLEERLVFVAEESSLFQLYHRSIAEIIMSVKPKGFVFVPIEEWYPEIICAASGEYGWGNKSEAEQKHIIAGIGGTKG